MSADVHEFHKGSWRVAVPLPYQFVLHVKCGQCGRRFWGRARRQRYESHYRIAHIGYQPGDRVRLWREDRIGTIHAIWPGAEDTIEILLDSLDGSDSGEYVCRDPRHLKFVSDAGGER